MNIMNIKTIIIFIMIVKGFNVSAQQDVQFTDYKLNMSIFNPAFSGYFDGSVLLVNRAQFVGIAGAPRSLNMNVNIPLNEKMGIGFNVSSDRLGVTDQTILTADYSYSFYTNDYNMLTFGLKAGMDILNIDFTKLNIDIKDDESFLNINNRSSPKIGVGFLYNTTDWFIGVSTPNFIKQNYNPTITGYTTTSKPHIYFITGFQAALNEEVIFKPSVLLKSVSESPLAVDMILNFEFREKFRFGLSYRWDSAISGIIGLSFWNNYQAGYAYDHSVNGLGRYAPTSHQFYMKYTFRKSHDVRRECPCSFSNSKSDLSF